MTEFENEPDGPPDEIEVGEAVEAEVGRLVRHPRQEAARLRRVGTDGEHGSAPFIEIGLVARLIIPVVLLVIGVALLVYYEA